MNASTSSMTPSSSRTRQTSRRSSSTSTQTPADRGKTTWSPGLTGILKSAMSGGPSPTARTMPSLGGRSFVPCGTSRPDLRIRSGSSSLITTWSKSGRRTSDIWALLSLEVRDRVGLAEPLGREAPGVARPELAGVRLQQDLRCTSGRDRQEADGRIGCVHELVRALLTGGERDDLTRLEVAPAVRRAQPWGALQHDEHLLLG